MSAPSRSQAPAASLPFRGRRTKQERPIGVSLVALIQGVNAVTTGLEVAAGERAIPADSGLVLGPLGIVVAVGGLLVAAGLWRLERWAWTATMLWVGSVMALALFAYFHGNPSYIVMALCVIQVLYLNQSEVQGVFRPRSGDGT